MGLMLALAVCVATSLLKQGVFENLKSDISPLTVEMSPSTTARNPQSFSKPGAVPDRRGHSPPGLAFFSADRPSPGRGARFGQTPRSVDRGEREREELRGAGVFVSRGERECRREDRTLDLSATWT